jgi:membrane protein YdbS with pleckstrin-like domain
MLSVLADFAIGEVAKIRKTISRLKLFAAIIVLLFFAAFFALQSVYLFLAASLPAWQAALLVAVGLIVVCSLVWILAQLRTNRNSGRQSFVEAEIGAFSGLISSAPRGQKLSIVATAVLLGLVIGRRLSK